MVENWSTPERLKELQSFLGYISYYRRCVPWFATVASLPNASVPDCCRDIYGKQYSTMYFMLAGQKMAIDLWVSLLVY